MSLYSMICFVDNTIIGVAMMKKFPFVSTCFDLKTTIRLVHFLQSSPTCNYPNRYQIKLEITVLKKIH